MYRGSVHFACENVTLRGKECLRIFKDFFQSRIEWFKMVTSKKCTSLQIYSIQSIPDLRQHVGFTSGKNQVQTPSPVCPVH